MVGRLFRPVISIGRTLFDDGQPQRLAWGVALGVALGIIPKANLIAVALTIGLFSLRVNLASGLCAAAIFWPIGWLLDPITDHLGRSILQLIPLQSFFARLQLLPTMAWTDFNNTVVMGSLFIGLLQLYPTYRIVRRYAERYQGRLNRVLHC